MPALVPELVNAAIDASVSPGDLLRRALVVARRLAVPELVDWISSELNGYYSGEVTYYRRVQGQLMAENPIHGPIPFFPPCRCRVSSRRCGVGCSNGRLIWRLKACSGKA